MEDSVNQLLVDLHQATLAGKLKWEKSAVKELYTAPLTNGYVQFGKFQEYFRSYEVGNGSIQGLLLRLVSRDDKLLFERILGEGDKNAHSLLTSIEQCIFSNDLKAIKPFIDELARLA